ncbi:hypothetical protein ACFQGE_02865 [Halomicroarcula sp. GCM10025817]|nr:hypothetical protein [Halomicroarcula sp. SYNS111]
MTADGHARSDRRRVRHDGTPAGVAVATHVTGRARETDGRRRPVAG